MDTEKNVLSHKSNDHSLMSVGQYLGPQIRKATVMRSASGKDRDGRHVIYTVVAGSPAIFTMIDVLTEQVVKSIPMPETSGAWSVAVSTDGSAYIGAYNRGLLYRYIPESEQLINLGFPFKTKDAVLYPMAAGPNGMMYGSTYPTAHLYAYDPATDQFTDFGTMSHLDSGERWTRVVIYDDKSHKIYAGVGNVPRLLEFDLTTGAKRDLLPTGFDDIIAVYDLNLVEGKLFARKEANNAYETFVLDAKSGRLVEVISADTNEKSYGFINYSRGVSPKSPVENKVYYTTAGGQLHEYDLVTDTYRDLGVSLGGAALSYEFVQLDDAEEYPGYTLIGLASNAGLLYKSLFKKPQKSHKK